MKDSSCLDTNGFTNGTDIRKKKGLEAVLYSADLTAVKKKTESSVSAPENAQLGVQWFKNYWHICGKKLSSYMGQPDAAGVVL